MKSINSTFDKFDSDIAESQYKIGKVQKDFETLKKDLEAVKNKKSEVELVEEVRVEFENLKKFTEYIREQNMIKIGEFQEFLAHYTPIQTHIQVLEAFDYLGCLSSEHKLSLFKQHQSRILKIGKSKKSAEYYFINAKKHLDETIDSIISNADKSMVDPKLIERVQLADTEQSVQTDPMKVKFEGTTNFRQIWLVRTPKEGYRYSQHMNRYVRMKMMKERKLRIQSEIEESESELSVEESGSEQSDNELESIESSNQENQKSEHEDRITPLPQENDQKHTPEIKLSVNNIEQPKSKTSTYNDPVFSKSHSASKHQTIKESNPHSEISSCSSPSELEIAVKKPEKSASVVKNYIQGEAITDAKEIVSSDKSILKMQKTSKNSVTSKPGSKKSINQVSWSKGHSKPKASSKISSKEQKNSSERHSPVSKRSSRVNVYKRRMTMNRGDTFKAHKELIKMASMKKDSEDHMKKYTQEIDQKLQHMKQEILENVQQSSKDQIETRLQVLQKSQSSFQHKTMKLINECDARTREAEENILANVLGKQKRTRREKSDTDFTVQELYKNVTEIRPQMDQLIFTALRTLIEVTKAHLGIYARSKNNTEGHKTRHKSQNKSKMVNSSTGMMSARKHNLNEIISHMSLKSNRYDTRNTQNQQEINQGNDSKSCDYCAILTKIQPTLSKGLQLCEEVVAGQPVLEDHVQAFLEQLDNKQLLIGKSYKDTQIGSFHPNLDEKFSSEFHNRSFDMTSSLSNRNKTFYIGKSRLDRIVQSRGKSSTKHGL